MKTLNISIIVILAISITSSGIAYAEVTSGPVLFMKSNSVAQIYANYTFHVLDNHTWNLSPGIFTGVSDSSVPKDLTIVANPSSIIANKNSVPVTFTITAKNDVKGVYALFLFFCGESPLVVGLNESETNPAILNQFFNAQYMCPMMGASTPDLNIVGYSGIVSKTISTIPSDTNIVEIQNIQVRPPAIKVGDTFTINATLANNSPNSISLQHGVCEGLFSVTFDNHVTVDQKKISCPLMLMMQKLDPGQKTTGTSPGPSLTYRAAEAGTANATVTFSYGVWDQISHSNTWKTISKSFSFTISDNNTASKTVNETVLSPLKQFKSGIKIQDIVCKQGLTLLASHYGSPACIRPEHVQKFVQNNWNIVDVSPKYSHINLQVWGSYSPGTLQDHFLRGNISSRAGPISNATVLISVNGVTMGNATSTNDGCFQFNKWDEQKFSSKVDEFVKEDQTKIEHSPPDLLFTARYLGDENHNPVTATQNSYLYLYAVPLAPAQYDTNISPSSEINITQGSYAQFQMTIKPFSKDWQVQHMKLGLQRTPCGLTYDISPTENSGDSVLENHPGSFNVNLATTSYTQAGRYWIMITQDTSGLDNSNIDADVGAFFLNVMRK